MRLLSKSHKGRGGRLLLTIGIALIAIASLYSLRVDTDITAFLPFADAKKAEAIRLIAQSPLNRVVTVAVDKADDDNATAAKLAQFLRERDDVAWVRAGSDEALQKALYKLYFPHRFHFAARDQEQAKKLANEDSLRQRAANVRRQLQSPMGPFVRQMLGADPALFFLEHLESMQTHLGKTLDIDESGFRAKNGKLVFFFATKESAFNTRAQRPIISALREKIAAISGRVRFASLAEIAITSENTIRADIQRLGAIGSAIVIALLWLLFGSPKWVLLGTFPLAFGMLIGLACVNLFFPSVHGLTLAFGATLIGVAIDYVAHLLTHSFCVTKKSPHQVAHDLRRPLFLGALTTIAGVLGLALAGFVGLAQMAVFTATGLAAALLVTFVILPDWMPRTREPSRLFLKAGDLSGKLASKTNILRPIAYSVIVAGFGGLFFAELAGDIRALSVVDSSIERRHQELRKLVGFGGEAKILLVRAANADEALSQYEKLRESLPPSTRKTIRGPELFLRSASKQKASAEALRAGNFKKELLRIYESEGFVGDAFSDFENDVDSNLPPLRYADIRDSAATSLIDSFILEQDDEVSLIALVKGNENQANIEKLASENAALTFVDQKATLDAAFQHFQNRTLMLVGLGLLLVMATGLFRYRNLGDALFLVLPPFAATLVAFGFISILGDELTLIHLLASILILSMGVDYGIFLLESDDALHVDATRTGLVIAATSTIASFGLLGMSEQPALRGIGLTTSIGVFCCVLFVFAFARRRQD